MGIIRFADNKVYVSNSEHSPIGPKSRGAPLICIDIEGGQPIWKITLRGTDGGGKTIIGDSIIAMYNSYDPQVIGVGK
jgi:hypothetical protein